MMPLPGRLLRSKRQEEARAFNKWRAKYGGTDASMISQIKTLEDEN
jgi:putative transposase